MTSYSVSMQWRRIICTDLREFIHLSLCTVILMVLKMF